MKFKKILLTGSAGMVGRNIVENIEKNKYQLLTPSKIELNLLNLENIRKFLNFYKPDCIIHAAGKVGGIKVNMQDPFGFCFENVLMGSNLVKASLENDVNEFINLGSSCMYPSNFKEAIDENDLLSDYLEPTNEGYAIAKITTAKLCEYVTKQFSGKSYKTLLPCNLFGKYDKFDLEKSHLVPSAIRKIHTALIKGESEVVIWGKGEVKREFMYVNDLVSAIFFCLERIQDIPNFLNIGTGIDYTIKEYYEVTKEVIGYKGDFVYDLEKPEGMKRKLINSAKINSLGWKSSTNLYDGIKNTYEYFKSLN